MLAVVGGLAGIGGLATWSLDGLPACAGALQSSDRSLIVLGTVHTPSAAQSADVAAVIARHRPDVVLIELDQERLLLLAERGGVSSLYGSELAVAAHAARAVGAAVVLGDTVRPLPALLSTSAPLADPERLVRAARLAFYRPASAAPPGLVCRLVDVRRTLASDPTRAAPLVAAAASILGGVALSAAMEPPQLAAAAAAPLCESWTAAATRAAGWVITLLLSALAVRVADGLLISRDDELADNALRSLELAAGMRSGELLRRSFAFPTTAEAIDAATAAAPPRAADLLPFFPLRRPIGAGEERRLNLFEPRWLALMDELGGGSSAGLPGTTLGVLHALNKCYYEADGAEARRVDVVVRRVARRVRVHRCEEGTRPVTGRRRLIVHIVGEEELELEPQSLRGDPGGFLVGRVAPLRDGLDGPGGTGGGQRGSESGARVVCVVGLAHANGVLARCAERRLSLGGDALGQQAADDELDQADAMPNAEGLGRTAPAMGRVSGMNRMNEGETSVE